ncbi:hypothetical protein T4D_4314 [Trichinella pseudospiralis]|uniref:Uncharacterized protein n=1 Tax=Trichinella pseudospiralis TaxID=6337 RepID=A0A0V1FXG8_TRIPS|nr:hypothetical protein T4D_4314 [Trichinella pseudospiralis]
MTRKAQRKLYEVDRKKRRGACGYKSVPILLVSAVENWKRIVDNDDDDDDDDDDDSEMEIVVIVSLSFLRTFFISFQLESNFSSKSTAAGQIIYNYSSTVTTSSYCIRVEFCNSPTDWLGQLRAYHSFIHSFIRSLFISMRFYCDALKAEGELQNAVKAASCRQKTDRHATAKLSSTVEACSL